MYIRLHIYIYLCVCVCHCKLNSLAVMESNWTIQQYQWSCFGKIAVITGAHTCIHTFTVMWLGQHVQTYVHIYAYIYSGVCAWQFNSISY